MPPGPVEPGAACEHADDCSAGYGCLATQVCPTNYPVAPCVFPITPPACHERCSDGAACTSGMVCVAGDTPGGPGGAGCVPACDPDTNGPCTATEVCVRGGQCVDAETAAQCTSGVLCAVGSICDQSRSVCLTPSEYAAMYPL